MEYSICVKSVTKMIVSVDLIANNNSQNKDNIMSKKDYICRSHTQKRAQNEMLRTLFYQFLLLFVGASIGFITNAEWVGWK